MAKRFTYGVNIAPLIDVVFILLAFMLIYSRLEMTESIEVDLPKVGGQATESESPLILSINKGGEIFWGTSQIGLDELQIRVAELGQKQPILLQSDRDTDAEALVGVMAVLSKAGISAVSIKVAGKGN